MPPKSTKKRYEKKDPISHCLDRPDMYVGSTRLRNISEYIAEKDDKTWKIYQQEIKSSPAILRIFVEALSNAVDNVERSKGTTTPCTKIKVNINEKTGETSIWNDGDVVPIEINEDENCYNHSMIFGQLLTGSNYDDEEERVTAGRNGLGIKLVSIFSKKFEVEGCDPTKKLILNQVWTNNMRTTQDPTVKSSRLKGYTKVSWTPDFIRFGLTEYTQDIIKLYTRYVIDAAMISKIQVYLNDELIPVKSLSQYAELYSDSSPEKLLIKHKTCEVLVTPATHYQAISFVNGVYTRLGGQHVESWAETIFRPIVDKFNGKDKKQKIKSPKITIVDVKQFFRIFVVATVIRPEFNGQDKERLESPSIPSEIKSSQLSTIYKWSVMEKIEDILKSKELGVLKKVEKKKKFVKIDGMDQANNAGSKHSSDCSLFICEGLSAKTYVVAGIDTGVYGRQGRDWFGVLPVTGKVLNVRNATPTTIAANKVIVSFIQALGLQHGLDYTEDKNFKTLNYGRIILIADADCFTGDTPIIIKNTEGTIDVISMESLYNMNLDSDGKFPSVWSDGGWTDIMGIKQKSSTKSLIEISTHCGLVKCTEDHECILEDGTSIKAKDIRVGHKLLRTRRIEPPTLEGTYTTTAIKTVARKLQCYNSSAISTKELPDCIANEAEFCHSPNTTDIDYGITNEEAWVWGFFFAEGTCDIYTFSKDREKHTQRNTITSRNRWYKWIDKYENRLVHMSMLNNLTSTQKKLYYMTKIRLARAEKNTQRISYEKNSELIRTNYCWSITNCNRELLEKSKIILEKYYPEYNWTIVEVAVRPENSRQFRLILNGGKTTADFISTMRQRFYDPIIRKNKKVPQEILNSSIDIQQSFFDGYYSGDGFRALRDTKNALGFDILGQIGAQGMCYLVERLGYCVNIRRRKGDIYTIHMSKHFRRMYPGLVHSVKYITQDTENIVYDIETNNHHLNAGVGGLVVHNCDGLHIESLLINLVHGLFPTLLHRKESYITSMKTPIVRIFRPKCNDLLFYDEVRFQEYVNKQKQKINVKYYKGLGTTRAEDVPDTFGLKMIEYNNDTECDENMNKIFTKKHTDQRKQWLGNYDPSKNSFCLDDQSSLTKMNISDFLNYHLIKFSLADCKRSIPNGIDGLKESQRKILYSVRKRNLKFTGKSLKVAQLSGYTAEHSNYHHGEQNLQDTIICMAHDFPGTNNIPLLYPDGGFGTRLENGHDAASARYIFTKMEGMTDKLFPIADDPLLKQVNDDGDLVQPEHYVPIIPMILVNGCTCGIGTGWSCNIPCYNPKELIQSIKIWIENDGEVLLEDPDTEEEISLLPEIIPWYRGYKGEIKANGKNKYISYGIVESYKKNKKQVTELPVGMWTNKFKEFCEDLVVDKKIKDLNNYSTPKDVNFILTEHDDGIECNMTTLKLYSYLYTSNMVLFTEKDQLKKYNTVDEIIINFCKVRLDLYKKRKSYQIDMLKKDLRYLGNKERFITEVINDDLVIMKKKEETVIDDLTKRKYDKDEESKSYDYLLRLQIRTFTVEKIQQLKNDIQSLQVKLDTLIATSAEQIWLQELEDLEKHYDLWLKDINNRTIKKSKK